MEHDKKHLLAWLEKHPLIALTRLESMLGIPIRTLHKAIYGSQALPEKWVTPLVEELKHYGYISPAWIKPIKEKVNQITPH